MQAVFRYMKMMKYLLPNRHMQGVFILVWLLVQSTAAQDASKVIDIKQRLLKPQVFFR
jgi:hypothetical protein